MIEHLNENWDIALWHCFDYCGPGIDIFNLDTSIRHIMNEMVNDCCDILSENKSIQVKAEYLGAVCNFESLDIYAVYNIINPAFRMDCSSNRARIKIPRGREFNENRQDIFNKMFNKDWNVQVNLNANIDTDPYISKKDTVEIFQKIKDDTWESVELKGMWDDKGFKCSDDQDLVKTKSFYFAKLFDEWHNSMVKEYKIVMLNNGREEFHTLQISINDLRDLFKEC